jgi:hypothetical protein
MSTRPLARLAAALALLAVVPSASAHGGGGAAKGYHSTISAIRPATPGLVVKVVGGDDRLHVENRTGKQVLVNGYEHEPYIRFDADGEVDVNSHSPAVYLNLDRYGLTDIPKGVSASATPHWEKVASNGTWEWHDHRIHWMSTLPPPVVSAAKGTKHHILDWNVPVLVANRPVTIHGSLDYAPPRRHWMLFAAVVGLQVIVVAVVLWLLLVRPRRRRARERGDTGRTPGAPKRERLVRGAKR